MLSQISISLVLMSALYLYSGIQHFRNPKFFLKLMPPYVPKHQLMVDISGIAEIVLSIGLLFSATQSLAAWGVIVLLIAVFPANIYMATAINNTITPQAAHDCVAENSKPMDRTISATPLASTINW